MNPEMQGDSTLAPRSSTDRRGASDRTRPVAAHLVQEQRERWQDENRDAIAAYNHHVEGNRVFSDGIRGF